MDLKTFGEKMIAAGENMEDAGKATSKAGGSITKFVFSLFMLMIIMGCLWSVFTS